MKTEHLETVGDMFTEEKIQEMFQKLKKELEHERDTKKEQLDIQYQREIDKMYGQLKSSLVKILLPEMFVEKKKVKVSRVGYTIEEDKLLMELHGKKMPWKMIQNELQNNGFPFRTTGSLNTHVSISFMAQKRWI